MVQYYGMKSLIVFTLLCLTTAQHAVEDFTELRTLDGKLYRQVKVTKTSPAEIRIMHADGFSIIPLSALPPEVLVRFASKVDKTAEELAEAERKLNNSRAYTASRAAFQANPSEPAPVSTAAAPQVRMDEYIAAAIANRRLLMIAYDNGVEGPRLVEPHFLGVTTTGHWALSGWFREGASKSGQGEGWRTYFLEKITAMEMVNQVFAGARPGYDPEGGGLFQSYAARLPGAGIQASPSSAAPVINSGSLSTRQATPVGRSSDDPQRIAEQMARQQRQQAVGAVAGGGAVVVQSNIDGEFTGFEGERVFKLLNGQVWQQADFYYHYHYAYGPRVLIYQAAGGWMMKVDGVEKAVRVNLLR